MSEIFKQASRQKVRFRTSKGVLTVEDVWELELEEIDQIYRTINAKRKERDEEGLIQKTSRTRDSLLLDLKAEILTDIFSTKSEEAAAKKLKAQNKAKKDQILALIAQKQDDALAGKSIEELTAMIQEL